MLTGKSTFFFSLLPAFSFNFKPGLDSYSSFSNYSKKQGCCQPVSTIGYFFFPAGANFLLNCTFKWGAHISPEIPNDHDVASLEHSLAELFFWSLRHNQRGKTLYLFLLLLTANIGSICLFFCATPDSGLRMR